MSSSFIERFGEKTLRLLERVYLLAIDLLIDLAVFLSKVVERVEGFDASRLYPFFERRGIEKRDYTVFKLQVSSSLFLVLTTLFIINSIGARRYIFSGGLLAAFSIYILFSTVKRDFEDFNAYRDFFLSYYLLAVLLASIKTWKPFVSIWFPFFHFALFSFAPFTYYNFAVFHSAFCFSPTLTRT